MQFHTDPIRSLLQLHHPPRLCNSLQLPYPHMNLFIPKKLKFTLFSMARTNCEQSSKLHFS
jgi:hypothetical protein